MSETSPEESREKLIATNNELAQALVKSKRDLTSWKAAHEAKEEELMEARKEIRSLNNRDTNAQNIQHHFKDSLKMYKNSLTTILNSVKQLISEVDSAMACSVQNIKGEDSHTSADFLASEKSKPGKQRRRTMVPILESGPSSPRDVEKRRSGSHGQSNSPKQRRKVESPLRTKTTPKSSDGKNEGIRRRSASRRPKRSTTGIDYKKLVEGSDSPPRKSVTPKVLKRSSKAARSTTKNQSDSSPRKSATSKKVPQRSSKAGRSSTKKRSDSSPRKSMTPKKAAKRSSKASRLSTKSQESARKSSEFKRDTPRRSRNKLGRPKRSTVDVDYKKLVNGSRLSDSPEVKGQRAGRKSAKSVRRSEQPRKRKSTSSTEETAKRPKRAMSMAITSLNKEGVETKLRPGDTSTITVCEEW